MTTTTLHFIDEEQADKMLGAAATAKIREAITTLSEKHGKRCVRLACEIMEQQQLCAFATEQEPSLRRVLERVMEVTVEAVSICGAPKLKLAECILVLRPLFLEVRNALNKKFEEGGEPVVVAKGKLHKGES